MNTTMNPMLEAAFLSVNKDTNSDIRLGLRRLLASPILLMNDAAESFEEHKEHLPTALQPVVDYFSITWIGDYAFSPYNLGIKDLIRLVVSYYQRRFNMLRSQIK